MLCVWYLEVGRYVNSGRFFDEFCEKKLFCHFLPFLFVIFTIMRFSAKNWKDKDARAGAKAFAERWKGKGYEKGESQKFWLDLLCNVFGVKDFANFISFEDQVKLDHTSFIDCYIPSTRVLIEQKSVEKDLRAPSKQSDGRELTPFQQAKRYITELPVSKHPRWVVTCNFAEFLIYDMEKPSGEPEQVLLANLERDFYRLQFLVDSKSESIRREEEISLKAGELVGKIYDSLLPEFGDKPTDADYHALNVFCVRLVFCLYAEDAGIFNKEQFYHYLKSFRPENMRVALRELFRVLDTPMENRDRFMEEKLAEFPYVNGSLFHEKEGEAIPPISEKTAEILLNRASLDFDWSEISPTIFGAVFESTLNPETRRSGGMHYTSIENIHKVIDPLFLDDLKSEFHEIVPSMGKVLTKAQRQKLLALQDKLGSLKFLDPACGSGNFLTETYTSLRKLENQILTQLMDDKIVMGEIANPVKVDITQFYGIEINDFAVNVAKSALWIAESQMLKETETIVQRDIDFLPLKTNATIVEGNALRMDWTRLDAEDSESEALVANKLNIIKVDDLDSLTVNDVRIPYEQKKDEITVITREVEYKDPKDIDYSAIVNKAKRINHYDYIMGNPPFVGARMMNKQQKDEVFATFGKNWQGVGDLDYVCCWYKKAADLIEGSQTHCAFVSTNSITQGGSVTNLWKPLFEQGFHIDFAWRTFRWDSESSEKAHVHCVVIGFSVAESNKPKVIFLNENEKIVAVNINGYLLNAPNVFVEKRMVPLCNVPQACLGGQPIDDGNLVLTEEEKDELIKKDPLTEKFVRHYMMGKDFIDRKPRYCLWLQGANPTELRKCHEIMHRVEKVREFRLASNRTSTLRAAEMPTLFGAPFECQSDYIAIPKVSSENRRYIPIDYLFHEVIPGDNLFVIQQASLYHFGVLASKIHNAWIRAVCGRLKSDYRYSNTIVYNNFPWSEPTEKKKTKIEQTAQNILDVRAKFPDSSLADLYDELTIPAELRKAHAENDKAVMEAYGFSSKMTEEEIVAELFKMYQELIKKEP